MPQALKIPDAKGCGEEKLENEENTGMAADGGQKQKRSDR